MQKIRAGLALLAVVLAAACSSASPTAPDVTQYDNLGATGSGGYTGSPSFNLGATGSGG